jgi:hypothetical protein
MKRLFGVIAAAALLALPINAMAQHGGGTGGHGGGGMGGGMGGHGGGMGGARGGMGGGRGGMVGGRGAAGWGGGWHGGAGHGGGWGGGWHGGGWGGGWHNHCCGFYPFFGGFALGFAAAYPWYYWGYPSDYWGPPYPYYGYDGYDGGPYDSNGDGYPDSYSGGYYNAPPAPAGPQACGSWVWHADQSRYQWVPAPCASTPAAPPSNY